jgi:hypothetical protein
VLCLTAYSRLKTAQVAPGDTWTVTRGRQVLPLFIAACLVLALPACGGDDDEPSKSEESQAVGQAVVAFQKAEQSGQDLSAGPCISESLPGLPDWVADVAHDPRQDVDDDPNNQCQRYRDGEASHFVELTPEGQLIRAE